MLGGWVFQRAGGFRHCCGRSETVRAKELGVLLVGIFWIILDFLDFWASFWDSGDLLGSFWRFYKKYLLVVVCLLGLLDLLGFLKIHPDLENCSMFGCSPGYRTMIGCYGFGMFTLFTRF